jgi:hypothetical protein
MQRYLLLLLLVAPCYVTHWGEASNGLVKPATACSTAAVCQRVPNAVAMKCSAGICVPECLPGFNLSGVACVSGALAGLASASCCCKVLLQAQAVMQLCHVL